MPWLLRELADPERDPAHELPPSGQPGKCTMTSRLAPRPSITIELDRPDLARDLGAALGFGGRDAAPRPPAPVAAAAIARVAAPLDDPFGVHLPAPPRATTLQVSSPHDALEHEADRAATAMVRGETATVSGGGGGAQLARDVDPEASDESTAWNPQYDQRYKRTRPKGASAQADFDAERASGKVKSASSQGGTKVKTQLSSDQVHRIIAAGGETAAADRCAPMAGGISGAFETMLIDTAQAQADYLAHMAGETGGVLEEIQGDKRSYAPFQGRGAVQVTHPENYAKALGTLQQRADQIAQQLEGLTTSIRELTTQREQATNADEKAKLVTKLEAANAEAEALRKQLGELTAAIDAIKADPKAAADPKYAFLLSAGIMHKTGAVGRTSKLGATAAFDGNGAADSWVSGGNKGMTFDARRAQNEAELADINQQLATTTDPEEKKKLQGGAAGRTRLIEDMKSAKSRGQKKAKVYAAGVRILSAENAVGGESDDAPAD